MNKNQKIQWIINASIHDVDESLTCDLSHPESDVTIETLRDAILIESVSTNRSSMIALLERHIRKRGGEPNEVKAELLAPEDPSAVMEGVIAAQVLRAHELVGMSGKAFVVGALSAGMFLQRAKDIIPHGSFTDWCKKRLPSIPARTARKYLQHADEFRAQLPEAWDTVRRMLPENADGKLDSGLIKRLAPQVSEITGANTFADLGRELGIIPPRNTKARRAVKASETNTGDPEADAERQAAEWASRVCAALKPARHYRNTLDPEEKEILITSIAQAFEDLEISPRILLGR